LTISVPLVVGEAPVENSWGSYKIKNVAQKKLVSFGTFRLIPYMHKIWNISTMNLPVQDLIRQKWFFGQMQKLKISISKIKSHMLIKAIVFNFLHIFQLIQKVLNSYFLNLVSNIHICLHKNYKILFLLEKNNF
jgi:hypothetical protein